MTAGVLSTGEPIDLPRLSALRVVEVTGKGRAVVAVEPIQSGALIEASPVIRLRPDQSPELQHPLFDYTFCWDEPPYAEAIALGLVSLVNHAPTSNATLHLDFADRSIRMLARRDIEAGEEITIDYGIPLWFEPAAA